MVSDFWLRYYVYKWIFNCKWVFDGHNEKIITSGHEK